MCKETESRHKEDLGCVQFRFWNKVIQTRVHELFCLCEAHPVQKLLNTTELNQDDVSTTTIFCCDHGVKDIYAADTH